MKNAYKEVSFNNFSDRALVALFLVLKASEADATKIVLSHVCLKQYLGLQRISNDWILHLIDDLNMFFPQAEAIYPENKTNLVLLLPNHNEDQYKAILFDALPSRNEISEALDMTLRTDKLPESMPFTQPKTKNLSSMRERFSHLFR